MGTRFWIVWAARDLRPRWLQVLAIAVIIALATGVYAGLGGQESWRVASMDLSYEGLQLHDLKLRLAGGSLADQTRLLAELAGIDGVARMEPGLTFERLVDASTDQQTILVPGRIVGVSTSAGGPLVDRIHVDAGRGLTDSDRSQAVLETKFARYYDLGPGATLQLMGGGTLEVVGLGQSPEHFYLLPEHVGFALRAESNMAVIYVPLATAQALYQQPGLINELRIQLDAGADPAAVRSAVKARLDASLMGISAHVTHGADLPSRAFLYADAQEDQEMLDLIALFFLLGASLAAFNLAGRIVEAQRREIGIGMALGTPRTWLAARPLAMGLLLALLGTALGLPMAFALTGFFGSIMLEFVPLPYTAGTMLHPPGFLQAVALGILLPLAAVTIPVVRAVSMSPLEAIKGHTAAKSSGLNRWFKNLRLPGGTFAQLPLKNALRTPKRTLITVLGLSLAIALMVLFLGLLDTMTGTMDQAGQSLLHRSPDRVILTLDGFAPADGDSIRDLSSLTADGHRPLFAASEPGLLLSGRLHSGAAELETLLELVATPSEIWQPTLLEGSFRDADGRDGIVISQKAADDLGIGIGDALELGHPFREGQRAFRSATTGLVVSGIHDNPLRGFSYMTLEAAPMFGMEGLANMLISNPAPGTTLPEIQQRLFLHPLVVSVQAISALLEGLQDMLSLFIRVLAVLQVIILLLAFLIAFNSTSINTDDRIREFATMFAFGTPPRTVTATQVGENLLLGIAATMVGGPLGWIVLNRLMVNRMEIMLEEINLLITIVPTSMALVAALGIGVVALTPLVVARSLRSLDIASTLRVME